MTSCTGCRCEVDTFNVPVWCGNCATEPAAALRDWAFENSPDLDPSEQRLVESIAVSLERSRALRMVRR